MHCQFFLLMDFKTFWTLGLCMYSNHLNSLKYHLYLTSIFCCNWNYQIFLGGLFSWSMYVPTGPLPVLAFSLQLFELFSLVYTQDFSRVPTLAFYSSPLTLFILSHPFFTILLSCSMIKTTDSLNLKPPTTFVPKTICSLYLDVLQDS